MFSRETSGARLEGRPIVALESALLTHGLPFPANLETVQRMEAAIRSEGAEPALIAVVGGQIRIGVEAEDLERLARGRSARKCSVRELPIAAARKEDGGTTVAATAWLAHLAGIRIMVTGGIGGVHRGQPFDVSADLDALARTPLIVVCSGAKAILDLPLTIEALETRGVPVVGYGCDEFPAFYSRRSGLPVDVRVDTPQEVADLAVARDSLGLSESLLVCVPVPKEFDIPAEEIADSVAQAVADAEKMGIRGKAITPFLLARVSELTGQRSERANRALLENNARVSAQIAAAVQSLPRARNR